MKTVLDHPIVAEGDVTQLRSFYNKLHNAVATMKSLGYSHDLASSTNTRAALQKLPDQLKERWGERKIEIHPTIPTLVDLSHSKPSRGGRTVGDHCEREIIIIIIARHFSAHLKFSMRLQREAKTLNHLYNLR